MRLRRTKLARLLTFLLILSSLAPGYSVVGQRRAGTVATSRSTTAAKCSGAWTGTVTYRRTQSRTDSKKIERVSGRGYDSRDWAMKYEYSARVSVVESPERDGSSRGIATINHNFSSTETVDAVELNSCDRAKTCK